MKFGQCIGATLGAFITGSALLSERAYALDYAFVQVGVPGCAAACPQAIVASGTITARESEMLSWFVRHSGRNRPMAKMLIIHSPGGNAYGGMALGTLARNAGMTVVVARASGDIIAGPRGLLRGICGSACVFVLAGGVKRVVPPGSAVAVHRARQNRTDMHGSIAGRIETRAFNPADITQMFGDYFASMGISRELATLAEQTPNARARFLSPSEMLRFRLATPHLQ